MNNQALIEKLERMGARETKAEYDIGAYWNAVDEAHDALEECDSENAAMRREVEALTLARDAAIREIGKWSGKAGRLEAVVEALRKLCGDAAQYILVMDIPDAMASDYHDRLTRAAKGE